MKFRFTGDKKLLNEVNYLKKHANLDEEITMSQVMIDSVHMFYQLNLLMDQGYKLAIIDKSGKKHFITKRKKKDNDK